VVIVDRCLFRNFVKQALGGGTVEKKMVVQVVHRAKNVTRLFQQIKTIRAH
jgi:hypothetical protein